MPDTVSLATYPLQMRSLALEETTAAIKKFDIVFNCLLYTYPYANRQVQRSPSSSNKLLVSSQQIDSSRYSQLVKM